MTIAILRCERYRSDQCRRPSRAAEGWVVFLLAVVSNRTAPLASVSRTKGEVARELIVPGQHHLRLSFSWRIGSALRVRARESVSVRGEAVFDARDPSERRPRDRWPPCPPLPWRSAPRTRAVPPDPSPDPRESVVPSRHRAIRPRGSRGGVRHARRSRFHPDQLAPQGRAGGSHGRRHGHPPLLCLRPQISASPPRSSASTTPASTSPSAPTRSSARSWAPPDAPASSPAARRRRRPHRHRGILCRRLCRRLRPPGRRLQPGRRRHLRVHLACTKPPSRASPTSTPMTRTPSPPSASPARAVPAPTSSPRDTACIPPPPSSSSPSATAFTGSRSILGGRVCHVARANPGARTRQDLLLQRGQLRHVGRGRARVRGRAQTGRAGPEREALQRAVHRFARRRFPSHDAVRRYLRAARHRREPRGSPASADRVRADGVHRGTVRRRRQHRSRPRARSDPHGGARANAVLRRIEEGGGVPRVDALGRGSRANRFREQGGRFRRLG